MVTLYLATMAEDWYHGQEHMLNEGKADAAEVAGEKKLAIVF